MKRRGCSRVLWPVLWVGWGDWGQAWTNGRCLEGLYMLTNDLVPQKFGNNNVKWTRLLSIQPVERLKTNTNLWKFAILKNFESRINSNNIEPLQFKSLMNYTFLKKMFLKRFEIPRIVNARECEPSNFHYQKFESYCVTNTACQSNGTEKMAARWCKEMY